MSIRNEPHPPSWMSRLLHGCLPSGARGDSILGDLHQEYVGRPPGPLRVLWYLGASVRLGLTYSPSVFLSALRDGMAGLLGGGTGADARFALRRFRTRPAFPVIAVCTLALGIGATTAIFTVVDAALLRPLPYERPDEIHNVWNTYPAWRHHEVLQRMWDRIPLSYPEYRRWRDEQTAFESVAIYSATNMVL